MILYKYFPPERLDVLEKLRIRFSPAISTNDAFELKPLTKGWASKEEGRKILASRLEEKFSHADTPEKMLQVAISNHPEGEANFRRTMSILGPAQWLRLMKE